MCKKYSLRIQQYSQRSKRIQHTQNSIAQPTPVTLFTERGIHDWWTQVIIEHNSPRDYPDFFLHKPPDVTNSTSLHKRRQRLQSNVRESKHSHVRFDLDKPSPSLSAHLPTIVLRESDESHHDVTKSNSYRTVHFPHHKLPHPHPPGRSVQRPNSPADTSYRWSTLTSTSHSDLYKQVTGSPDHTDSQSVSSSRQTTSVTSPVSPLSDLEESRPSRPLPYKGETTHHDPSDRLWAYPPKYSHQNHLYRFSSQPHKSGTSKPPHTYKRSHRSSDNISMKISLPCRPGCCFCVYSTNLGPVRVYISRSDRPKKEAFVGLVKDGNGQPALPVSRIGDVRGLVYNRKSHSFHPPGKGQRPLFKDSTTGVKTVGKKDVVKHRRRSWARCLVSVLLNETIFDLPIV